MWLMLNPYRRHSKTCKHRDKGRSFRQCKCPIWAQGTVNGEPVKQALGTRDWAIAQDKCYRFELTGKLERVATVATVCAEFMADQEARNLSKSTLKKYRAMLVSRACESLTVYAEACGIEPIRSVDIRAVTAWRAKWEDAPITQAKKLERLKVFFRWCVDHGYMEASPAAAVKAPKVRQVPTLPLTRDEVAKLLAAALDQGTRAEGRRLRAYILVCRYTGLRRGDAATLACDALRGEELLLRQEKTGEPLYTLLPRAVVDELRHVERLSPRHWFWTGTGSTETVGGNYGRSFRRLCAKCGIENGHLHRLRDTFAVESLNAGVPIEIVSKLLGHASIRITERHYSPWVSSRQATLRREMEKLWAFDEVVQNWNAGKIEAVKH